MRWKCSRCGEWHEGLPFAYAAPIPAPYAAIPQAERSARAVLDEEVCVIDGKDFLVRARIVLPVLPVTPGAQPQFEWGVWVSLSKENFKNCLELWTTPGRETQPDYFCWLCSDLPTYPTSTLLLKGRLHARPVGERPVVELEPTDHLLAREQRFGIGVERVEAIAEYAAHHEGP